MNDTKNGFLRGSHFYMRLPQYFSNGFLLINNIEKQFTLWNLMLFSRLIDWYAYVQVIYHFAVL